MTSDYQRGLLDAANVCSNERDPEHNEECACEACYALRCATEAILELPVESGETPETDTFWRELALGYINPDKPIIKLLEFARSLERQRNAAKPFYSGELAAAMQTIKRLTGERNAATMDRTPSAALCKHEFDYDYGPRCVKCDIRKPKTMDN